MAHTVCVISRSLPVADNLIDEDAEHQSPAFCLFLEKIVYRCQIPNSKDAWSLR